MTTPSTRTALRRAAKKYAKAQEARTAAMVELVAAIRAADTDGVPRNEIVRETGLARATVYAAVMTS